MSQGALLPLMRRGRRPVPGSYTEDSRIACGQFSGTLTARAFPAPCCCRFRRRHADAQQIASPNVQTRRFSASCRVRHLDFVWKNASTLLLSSPTEHRTRLFSSAAGLISSSRRSKFTLLIAHSHNTLCCEILYFYSTMYFLKKNNSFFFFFSCIITLDFISFFKSLKDLKKFSDTWSYKNNLFDFKWRFIFFKYSQD